MPHLEDLWIKWSDISDITAVRDLRMLRYFYLGSSTKLRSIDPLNGLGRLKWLGLENLKLIRKLHPLGSCTQLEGLILEGSMWRTWRVATLEPLGALAKLRYLSLANLRSEDKTLAPLFPLHRLETLILAQWWDDEELAELRRRNPRLAA